LYKLVLKKLTILFLLQRFGNYQCCQLFLKEKLSIVVTPPFIKQLDTRRSELLIKVPMVIWLSS